MKTCTFQGLLFVPVLVDNLSIGGGGVLAVNPNTATTVLLNPLETGSISGARKHRSEVLL